MSEESVCFAGVTLNTAAIAAIPIAVERGECPSFPAEKRPKNEVRTDEGRFALQADRNGRWLNIKRADKATAQRRAEVPEINSSSEIEAQT